MGKIHGGSRSKKVISLLVILEQPTSRCPCTNKLVIILRAFTWPDPTPLSLPILPPENRHISGLQERTVSRLSEKLNLQLVWTRVSTTFTNPW
jgi:hypothetical protein